MESVNRATYRGQVTRLAKNASEYLQSADSYPKSENMDKWDNIEEELSVHLQRLKNAHESLNKANSEYRVYVKPEEFPKESESIADYEDKAISVIARITQRLAKLRRMQDPLLPQRNASSSPISSQPEKLNAVKLPKLPLKTFSGDFKEWLPFWEQFKTAIHESKSLSSADKFNYLQSALRGKAADTIAGFTPTEGCYDGALALLQEEFGNSDKLVDKNMQELMTIPAVNSRSDAKGLRRLYNTVMTCSRSLTALGIPWGNYSIMLRSKLLRCLPSELQVDFNRLHHLSPETEEESVADSTASKSDSEASVVFDGDKQMKALLKFIKREAESLENSYDERVQRKPPKVYTTTAAGLFTTKANNSCFFCKSTHHHTRDCSSPQTLQQRKEMLKQDGRCFRCTSRGHSSKKCLNRRLKCNTCKGCHAQSVCDPNYHRNITSESIQLSKPSVSDLNAGIIQNPALNLYAANNYQKLANVYLQTASVFALNSDQSKKLYVRLILDGGSQLSFIKESIAEKLNLPIIGTHNLSVISFGSEKQTPVKVCNSVRLFLRSQYDSRMVLLEAVVVPEICLDVLAIPLISQPEYYDLKLADARPYNCQPEEGIGILIGADSYWNFVTGEQHRLSSNLSAINTIFGWTLQGPAPVSVSSLSTGLPVLNALHVSAVDEPCLQQFWDLEVIGIMPDNIEAEGFNNDFSTNHITKKGGRYEVCLPWKYEKSLLDDNKSGALIRLNSLIKRLSRVPSKLLEYDEAMQDFISAGFAEQIIKDDEPSRSYYMPHRPVYRDDKTTTKLRIVFDASAHAENCLSLNDYLSPGPNMLPDVLKILLNFRLGSIGLVADIEKAFLQVSLDVKDRDVHRFFWFPEKLKSVERRPSLQIYRMTRVTFGVTCSPFLLNATLHKHLKSEIEQFPETCRILSECFYMDDMVCSAKNVEAAMKLYKEATEILKGASMNLRKWNTNHDKVRGQFYEVESPPVIQKVLGVLWYVHSDELATDTSQIESFIKSSSTKATKRSVLQVISRFFDPLGFLGPFLVRFKILFQDIWKSKLSWDEELPAELLNIWYSCCEDIKELKHLAIPRCIFQTLVVVNQELHLFSDASLSAYGAVAYVRAISEINQTNVQFLCAKNRVAPLKENSAKELTLPRLELTAALIAARLSSYICNNLKLKFINVYFWTDSKITLCWILNNNRKWKPYVSNRVQEINELTKKNTWSHCPGKDNPADLLTRGVSSKILSNSTLWRHGPPWLQNDCEFWPKEKSSIEMPKAVTALQIEASINEITSTKPLFPAENYSSWRKLLRVTAYVLRFTDLFRRRSTQQSDFLVTEELERAEEYWLKYAQRQEYQNEINALRNGKPIERSSKLLTLNPTLDEAEILRVNTRIRNQELNAVSNQPIILSKGSYISKLIVLDVHQRMMHSGVSAVLAELRQRFWVIKARQLIKGVVSKCTVCKMLFAKPASQPFAPLPRDRMTNSRPFEVTGVDFAGPLYVGAHSRDKATKKVYILLFTCAAVRAVHLELVADMSTDCFLMAFRRFIARRGRPKVIYSDNAKTFKRASKELLILHKLVRNEKVHGFISNQSIRWKFIVERAPWWGGFWERLVRSVKNVLKATIGRATLSSEELQTLLTEVESIINLRPLTYISDDPKDLAPLTPSHFLGSSPSISLPSASVREKLPDSAEIRKQWNSRLKSLNFFWQRWMREYLQQLRSLHHAKPVFSTQIAVNDIVLVYDQTKPRLLWKLGVVEEIFPGRDGKIRACQMRMPNGTKLRRPIQHLYPLELQ